MSEAPITRARIIPLSSDFTQEKTADAFDVQFNPESLKLVFSNQLQKGEGESNQNGQAAQQYMGAGMTKLSVQLWFDVTSREEGEAPARDVRALTDRVAAFLRPAQGEKAPPGLRFVWGSFRFDGMVESMEETLDFFSPDGRPLRATVSLGLTQQSVIKFTGAAGAGGAGALPGTRPLTAAPAGATLQQLAAKAGVPWQSVADGNGIENPRRLATGQLVDLAARARR